jgi:hypothetical protein
MIETIEIFVDVSMNEINYGQIVIDNNSCKNLNLNLPIANVIPITYLMEPEHEHVLQIHNVVQNQNRQINQIRINQIRKKYFPEKYFVCKLLAFVTVTCIVYMLLINLYKGSH